LRNSPESTNASAWFLFGLEGLYFLLAIQVAFAIGNSGRSWFALSVVPELGKDAALVIDLIGPLFESVVFASVHNQVNFLFRAEGDVVELKP
jgi:hypothetical protein